MSGTDYLNGMTAANFAHRRASASADDAIDSWKDFSGKLQTRLQRTEFDFVKAESGRIGFAHLFKTVVEELKRVDPNNPLLLKDNQLKILGTKVAEKVNEMGFVYDSSSGNVIGKR